MADNVIPLCLQRDDFSKIQFAAILVFHDSREWGRDTQIIIDILRSHNGVFGTEHPPTEPLPDKQIPIYFSHGDLREYMHCRNPSGRCRLLTDSH